MSAKLKPVLFDSGTVALPLAATTYTILSSTNNKGRSGILNFQLSNLSGTRAMDAFALELKLHPQGEWVDFISSTGWAATNNSNLLWFSGAPHTLTTSAKAYASVRINGAYAWRFRGSANGADGSVRLLASLTDDNS